MNAHVGGVISLVTWQNFVVGLIKLKVNVSVLHAAKLVLLKGIAQIVILMMPRETAQGGNR